MVQESHSEAEEEDEVGGQDEEEAERGVGEVRRSIHLSSRGRPGGLENHA
jgi:hypothetical protein